jgi:hypothetical protein
MGKKQKDPYSKAINILLKLKEEHPTYSLGQHLSTAFSDYGDIWGLTDNEIVFALEKYKTEIDLNIVSDSYVDKIVKDAENLDTLFLEEDDEDEYKN